METLTATREKQSTYNCITTLRDSKGFVKAILTGYQQPVRRQKTIVLLKERFNLEFSPKKNLKDK